MKVIDSVLRKNSLNKVERLETHLVFASHYYTYFHGDSLKSLILEAMKKYKIRSVMVTIINMMRYDLITKEAMEDICNGENYIYRERRDSVNDDLESLFENLRLGKQPLEHVLTYFFPKLTEKELELVARKDFTYFETLGLRTNKDVNEDQMKLSESDSKFVKAFGSRKTFTINNPSLQNSFRENLSRCSLQ